MRGSFLLINWEDVNLCDCTEGGKFGADFSSKYPIPFWSLRVYVYYISSVQENRAALIH